MTALLSTRETETLLLLGCYRYLSRSQIQELSILSWSLAAENRHEGSPEALRGPQRPAAATSAALAPPPKGEIDVLDADGVGNEPVRSPRRHATERPKVMTPGARGRATTRISPPRVRSSRRAH